MLGANGEVIPSNATHITVHFSVTVILAQAFYGHPNIIEVICHQNVEVIEGMAFAMCRRLRRVVIPGVKIVDYSAFLYCEALADVEECGMLEIIGGDAFGQCRSLRSIDLPSAIIVDGGAFSSCFALTDVKFGNNLEGFGVRTFVHCSSLERVTIPLKDGLIVTDGIFLGCTNLKHIDFVDEVPLHETIAALLLEDWRNDMNEEIDSINRILPNADAGRWDDDWFNGGKARAIGGWIKAVLEKIIHYQAEHQHVLNEAAKTLQHALTQDIVMNNVLPFLDLPLHTFEVVDDEDEGFISEDSPTLEGDD